MSTFDEHLGQWMLELRQHLGISQSFLAEQLGTEQPTVSKIERGQRRLTVQELVRWANAMGVEMELLCEKLEDLRREGGKEGYWE